jgi:release factor glutamine methyltransferase
LKVPSNKISTIISYYESLLQKLYSKEESAQLIRELIANFTSIKRNEISLNFEKRVSESQLLDIHFGVKDLLNNKPLQHIIGTAPCLDFDFIVNKDVLIPRPETEELVDIISKSIKPNSKSIKILDIGTGSGCIAIALQKTTNSSVTAIDISKDALKIAAKNAEINNANVEFIKLDILNKDSWHQLDNDFDIIVSNPPYVRKMEKKLMNKNVLDFDPSLALFVDDDNPLVFYEAITKFAKSHLKPNGTLWFEINEYLGQETKELILNYFDNVELIEDFRGKERFVRVGS